MRLSLQLTYRFEKKHQYRMYYREQYTKSVLGNHLLHLELLLQYNSLPCGSVTAGSYKSAGLPQHTHFVSNVDKGTAIAYTNGTSLTSSNHLVGSAYKSSTIEGYVLIGSSNTPTVGKTSNASNSIYGNSTTVQPNALACRCYIKY